jgi:hypothetical protein
MARVRPAQSIFDELGHRLTSHDVGHIHLALLINSCGVGSVLFQIVSVFYLQERDEQSPEAASAPSQRCRSWRRNATATSPWC